MRRTELVSVSLIACAVALGVWVVADRDKPTTSEVAARAGLILRVFRPDEVTRITMRRRDDKGAIETIELLRNGEAWQMTSPRNGAADFQEVSAVLNFLQGARSERSVGTPSAADRAQFGLDAPRVSVELAMKGVTLKVSLGGPATGNAKLPDDAGTSPSYLEVAPYADQPGGVFVVGSDVARTLDRPADTYRDRSLVAARTSTDVLRVRVRRGADELLAFDRGEHGTWRLPKGPSGAPTRADADAINGFWAAFADLKADPFVDDATVVDESKGGIVTLALSNGGEVEVAIGGACPKGARPSDERLEGDAGAPPALVLAQMRKPTKSTGCVPAYVADRLTRMGSTYVDEHAFGLLFGTDAAKVSEIESVVLERAGSKVLDAERAGSGLHVRVPSEQMVDKEPTDRFLVSLAATSGTLVAETDLDKLGLKAPVGRAIVKRKVDPLTLGRASTAAAGDDAGATGELWEQILEIGAPVELPPAKGAPAGPAIKVVHLRRLDDGAILRVPLETADALGPAAVRSLRDPNLVAIAEGSLTRLSVKGGGGIEWSMESVGTSFRLSQPKGLAIDTAAANDLAKGLAALSCDRWVAEKDDGTYGFSSPDLTLTITRDVSRAKEPGAPAELVVDLGGRSEDDRVYARVRGRDPVCALTLGRREAFGRVPVDRSTLAFDASVTPKLVVSRGKAKHVMVFRESDKRWHDGSDASDGKLPGIRTDVIARKLADMVIALRVEGLVHTGAATAADGMDNPSMVVEGFGGDGKARRVTIGAAGVLDRTPVYFARLEGVDATFAVVREEIDRVILNL